MARMSQKAFYEMATKLIREHGHVVIYYRDTRADYQRKRRINANGKCFVSHLGMFSDEWDSFKLSCFILKVHKRTIPFKLLFSKMKSHDRGWLQPTMIEFGRNKQRIER